MRLAFCRQRYCRTAPCGQVCEDRGGQQAERELAPDGAETDSSRDPFILPILRFGPTRGDFDVAICQGSGADKEPECRSETRRALRLHSTDDGNVAAAGAEQPGELVGR